MRDVYLRLAKHLQDLIMGYPYNEALTDLLKETYSPVDAVTMVDERPEVDTNWCIGCGVCAVSCPAEVISIKRRMESRAPESFADLHRRIKQEKELSN